MARAMKHSALIAFGAALALLISHPLRSAAAQESSPAVRTAIETFEEWMKSTLASGDRLTFERVRTKARAALEGCDFRALSFADIERLANARLISYAGREADARARLASFAAAETPDGAVAAVLLLTVMEDAADEEPVRAALRHPGLAGALATGRAGEIFGAVGNLEPDVLAGVFPDVVALAPYMTGDLPPQVVSEFPNLLEGLLALEGDSFAQGREALRLRMVAAMTAARDKAPAEMKAYLSQRQVFLNGAFARGELVGHVAPALDFTWTSSETPLASLADLRGKVVVLDFWATWCSPCVASFPRVRDLKERYADFPVAIVGVTSLQGSHHAPDGTRTDTQGKPELEHELMSGYLSQQEVTWTVAFSEQAVFNPEYGIQGIPHVAILDAEGRVRFRGLHPMERGTEDKIDALLREAGLPHPAAVALPAGFESEGR